MLKCFKNTVKNLTKQCAKDLFNTQEFEYQFWGKYLEILRSGKIDFIYGGELMDLDDDIFSINSNLLDVLCKHKANGDIYFEFIDYGSHYTEQGDRFWGYHFDGNGGYKKLEGKIVMSEIE